MTHTVFNFEFRAREVRYCFVSQKRGIFFKIRIQFRGAASH